MLCLYQLTMNQLEENVINSFQLAKSDVIRLRKDLLTLSQTQERVIELLGSLSTKELKLYERMKYHPHQKKEKVFVGSKNGKKMHLENCPFAQNIRPKSKVVFKSSLQGLNSGYKYCRCAQ